MHEPATSALAAGTAADHQHDDPHSEHGGEEHVSIPRMAVKVFIALCVLTCASLLTYTTYWQEHVPMEIGRAVMLTVSLTKAFLVVVFFMHLWWESKWKYVVTFPALTVSALLCIALIPDIGLRTREYDTSRLLNAPEAMPYTVGPELKVSQPAVTAASAHASNHAAEHTSDRAADSEAPATPAGH